MVVILYTQQAGARDSIKWVQCLPELSPQGEPQPYVNSYQFIHEGEKIKQCVEESWSISLLVCLPTVG